MKTYLNVIQLLLVVCFPIGVSNAFGNSQAEAVTEIAATPPEPEVSELIVYANPRAPFAFQDKDGEWHGIEILILEKVDSMMEENFSIKQLPRSDIKDQGIDDTEATLAIGAITRSSARLEGGVPFSYSVHQSWMRVAMRWEHGFEGGTSFVAIFYSFLEAFYHGFEWWHLLIIFILWGCFAWYHKVWSDPGTGHAAQGGLGILLLTVIATFVASIVVTAERHYSPEELSRVFTADDLSHEKVAALAGTPSYDEVARRVLNPDNLVGCNSVDEMRDLLTSDEKSVDYIAHEEALLAWDINSHCPGRIRFTGQRFGPQDYAWIYRQDADPDFVRRLNLAIQKSLEDPTIQHQIEQYLKIDN